MTTRDEYHPKPKAAWSEPGPAHRLAESICAYWRARGYEVEVMVSLCAIPSTMRVNSRDRAPRADIRSNLVNGLPPESARLT